MSKTISLRQLPQRFLSVFTRSTSRLSDTPVEEPPRDPNAPTRDNTDGGDRSPKPDRSNPSNNQDPSQVPRSPKRDR